MTVLDLGTVQRWEPDALQRAAGALARHGEVLTAQQRDVERLVRDLAVMPWQGAAASAAAERTSGLGAGLRGAAQGLDLARQVVAEAAAALRAALALLGQALALARRHGLTVLPDGTVRPPGPLWLPLDLSAEALDRVLAGQRAGAEAASEAQAMAVEALAAAQEADADAARALLAVDRLTGGSLPRVLVAAVATLLVQEVSARAVPGPERDALEVAAWWQSLPPDVQSRLSAAGGLGRRDGVPTAVRDENNRAVLAATMHQLAVALGQRPAARERWQLIVRLAMLQAVQQQLDAHPGATLLDLDTRLPGRAVLGLGDVEHAAHVAVLVPGMGSDVAHLSRVVDNARKLQDQAEQLADLYGAGSVATVAWIGYAAPMGWREAVGEGRAERGAPALQHELLGLEARAVVAGRTVGLTVSAHSYGSVLAGHALRAPTPADAFIAVGSPGLTVARASALLVQPGQVYVGEAPHDPIADAGRVHLFGPDPSSGRFGAKQLGLDGHEGLGASRGHTGYYDAGSESLHNQALVVVGRGDLVTGD